MNRSELITEIKANIAKSISLLQQAETRIEELEKTNDLEMFSNASEQIAIALEQVHEGINMAITGQKDAAIIDIFDKSRSKVGVA